MIYLNPEYRSLFGEDDFWTWFRRECPESRFMDEGVPTDGDIILQYAVLGPWQGRGRSVALLWELYPQMVEYGFHSAADHEKVARMHACAKAAWKKTAPTPLSASYFGGKEIDIMPIGVDAKKFRPVTIYGDTPTRAYWCGSSHPMKGYDLLDDELTRRGLECRPFLKERPVTQQVLVDEMELCDCWIRTSRLPCFYLSEWEAIMSGLPMIVAEGACRSEFHETIGRYEACALGWDRDISRWMRYLELE